MERVASLKFSGELICNIPFFALELAIRNCSFEKCEAFKNSQKPTKNQSDRHICFLETTGNLILIL